MRVCHWIKGNARSETVTRAIWFQAWTYPLKKSKYETEYSFEFIRMVRGTKDTKTGDWSYIWLTVRSAIDFWSTVDIWTNAKTKTYIICDQPDRKSVV